MNHRIRYRLSKKSKHKQKSFIVRLCKAIKSAYRAFTNSMKG